MSDARWQKSSYSGGGGNGECVEVALGARVGVRDTKDRAGGQLVIAPAAWNALTVEVKADR